MSAKTGKADLNEAAARLHHAAESGKPCAPVRDLIPGGDLESAYAVQEINTRAWLDGGRRLIGRKIGLTAKSVQAQLGVDQPDFGMLFADMCFGDGEELPANRFLQPRVEAEIAFVLDDDLKDDALSFHDVVAAVGYVLPAIEVADSRIRDWDITIVDTIADNASAGLFVLGGRPVALGDIDLRLCGMVIEHKGEPVSLGAGAACLNNPLNALVWLARTMARIGRPLQEGDIVMSGALGPMAPVRAGGVYEARINGLGAVRAVFEG